MSIIEAYLNHLYSAQLITVPDYTDFKSSRTKENITERRRSFVFAFECRRSSRRTNNEHSFTSSQLVDLRMHNSHSLVPSHEKRIVVGSLRNLNPPLILTAEQKNLDFSVGTRYHKNCTEKKRLIS